MADPGAGWWSEIVPRDMSGNVLNFRMFMRELEQTTDHPTGHDLLMISVRLQARR